MPRIRKPMLEFTQLMDHIFMRNISGVCLDNMLDHYNTHEAKPDTQTLTALCGPMGRVIR